jgi:transcriptional activator for dhaKLM operon
MSDGLLVWDASYMVTHLNIQGSKLLDLSKTRTVGRKLTEFLQLPEVVATAVKNDSDLVDTECSFNLGEQSHNFIINLRSARTHDQHLHLMTFRPVEEVRALVSKQVGAVARQTIDNLIGESKEMHQIRRQTQAAARGIAPVLVEGEAGTGKAIIARAIHQSSSRSNGPFVLINCRAIPRELTLSEFLGFQAGAYTNINQGGQPSKFELAHGGTLFLDEIDALPLDMQSALLSVIETSIVVRLGAQQAIPVDIRIIASTTAHLDEAMHDGGFRSDLYYRLRSIHIRTIPLRERQEDIPLLVQQKLSMLGRQIGHPLSLSDSALNAIYAYPWPGNIRELESALERAVVISETSTIEEQHLPRIIREGRVLTRFGTVEPVYSLEEVQQMAITRACQATSGNMSEAARMLGIGRATLYRKLEAMNLSALDFIENT